MKRIKLLSILSVVLGVLIVCVLGRLVLRNYIDAKKLVEAIKNEDLKRQGDGSLVSFS